MQFISQGPDVPDRLLQAHEDGRVAFFCGAGISCPAGLPTFGGLVKKLYEAMSVEPAAVEKSACKAGQYDTVVGLLEKRLQGGRSTVRGHLARILATDSEDQAARSTHEALLTLATDRSGRTRLITTNFDRLFEDAIARNSLSVARFQAPALPVPKRRWNGLVYLHGLLPPADPSDDDLERLVVSSGDFGLAYLTEGWAARFVSELFRNYVVCFVGYSISDPVMRYVVDALAADRLLGESSPEVFAFGGHCTGKEVECREQWEARNVTPILYLDHCRHACLHRTLDAWSRTYRDGVRGKERIFVEYAGMSPVGSTRQDDFAGRVIWALRDPSGAPARRFAELDPAPLLDWLEFFAEERLGHADLVSFGVTPDRSVGENLKFSLLRRPAPTAIASWMTLVGPEAGQSGWDAVMAPIAAWLLRHLGDVRLLLWFVRGGGVLHPGVRKGIEYELERLAELEHKDDREALDRICANAPNAVPSVELRGLWRLLLAGRVKTSENGSFLIRWRDRFRHEGLTTALRLELRDLLTPRVEISGPLSWSIVGDREASEETGGAGRIPYTRVVLSAPDLDGSLRELAGDKGWRRALPALLDDFTGLLRDALDLRQELGDADERNDGSWASQPSISEHPQSFASAWGWTALVGLVRDAWLATRARSPDDARTAAEAWRRVPYPVFRRLAFFAATHEDVIPRQQALDWLLADQRWWLWSPETLREAVRLLVALAPVLDDAGQASLEQAILVGPPRDMYPEGLEDAAWERLRDREIWLRCAKLEGSGATLSKAFSQRLDELRAQYPDWRLSEDDSEEFTVWATTGQDGRRIAAVPRDLNGLVEWLERNAEENPGQDDDWAERCHDDLDTTLAALSVLADQNVWPRRQWREALQAWSDEGLIKRSWSSAAAVVARMPESDLQALGNAVSFWLRAGSRIFENHEETFLSLCDRLLALEYEEYKTKVRHGSYRFSGEQTAPPDPVDQAINHSVGRVTEALIAWWLRSPLEDGQGLGDALKDRLSMICDTERRSLRHGRVLLAMYAVTFLRVDPDWTTRFLLPLFEWDRWPAEARSAWVGFLRSPRLYRPLMEALKPEFLKTAVHSEELGARGERYAFVLTYAALGSSDVFTLKELRAATASLSAAGRTSAARALVEAVKAAGDRAPEFWRNRVAPYLSKAWPKTTDAASESVAESFARACVAAKDAFPEALEDARRWLPTVTWSGMVVDALREAGLDEKFPANALDFLDLVVRADPPLPPQELPACLQRIKEAQPLLENDHRFRRLSDLVRAHQ